MNSYYFIKAGARLHETRSLLEDEENGIERAYRIKG